MNIDIFSINGIITFMEDKIMEKKTKNKINQILATVGFAMGVAVIVIPNVAADVSTTTLITFLGVAAVSFGILALNILPKEEKDGK